MILKAIWWVKTVGLLLLLWLIVTIIILPKLMSEYDEAESNVLASVDKLNSKLNDLEKENNKLKKALEELQQNLDELKNVPTG